MGCLVSQCSSRTLSMAFKAPRATLADKRRLLQATPTPRPRAPPSKPYTSLLLMDLSRYPGKLPKTPMQAPRAAGFKALRIDSLRNGVRDSPFKNASRPVRAPSIPECKSSRPYPALDFDHLRKSIELP